MTRFLRPGAAGAFALNALLLASVACHDRGVAGPDRPALPTRETQLIAAASGTSAANDVLLVQTISAALGGGGTSAARSLSLRAASGRGAPSADITYGGLTCTFDDETGWFTCPEVTLESMIIRAEFALFDTTGATQSAYDDTATVRAEVRYWARGTLVNPPGGAAIDRKRTLVVDSLHSGATQRIFSSVGTDSASAPLPDNSAQRYVLRDTTTAVDVALGVPFSANVWPLSGELRTDSRLDIVQDGTIVSTAYRHIVITFNGTQLVDMNVDGTFYKLDLATGGLTPDP